MNLPGLGLFCLDVMLYCSYTAQGIERTAGFVNISQRIAQLRSAAESADRDAESEWPGSYYRKAHRARARRLRRKAEQLQESKQNEVSNDATR